MMVLIGLFNGGGNFFQAIGIEHTAGTTQAVLQLMGIPIVLLLSWACLGSRPNLVAAFGAMLIVGGVALSALPHVLPSSTQNHTASDGAAYPWYSVLFCVAAQCFFSGEKVYEEATFGAFDVDVFTMFMWTLVTQFALGWVLLPVQSVPELGNISLSSIPDVFSGGLECTGAIEPGKAAAMPYCDWQSPVYMFVYCAVDYSYYALGLYFIRTRGASLMIIATTVSVPLCTVVYSIPELWPSQSQLAIQFLYSDAVALVLVLMGYGVYQVFQGGAAAAAAPASKTRLGALPGRINDDEARRLLLDR